VADGWETVEHLRSRLSGLRLGGYFTALPPATPASIVKNWPHAIASVEDAYLYHLGLLSQTRLEAVGEALTRAHARRAAAQ
jgi:ribosomal protein S18 acetylase RimI-like enzyme